MRAGSGLRHGLFGEHVLGKGEDHGSRPPRHRRVESVAQVLRDAARVVHLRDPFGELAEHAPVVDLLECLAIEDVAAGLSDEEQERRRVLEGGVDAHRGVGRARASRDEGDAGAAGELSVGIRHVRGAAFVPADDDADLFLRVVEGVEKTEVAFARDAEDVVGALGDEGPGQDLAAGAGEGGGGEHGGVVPRRQGGS